MKRFVALAVVILGIFFFFINCFLAFPWEYCKAKKVALDFIDHNFDSDTIIEKENFQFEWNHFIFKISANNNRNFNFYLEIDRNNYSILRNTYYETLALRELNSTVKPQIEKLFEANTVCFVEPYGGTLEKLYNYGPKTIPFSMEDVSEIIWTTNKRVQIYIDEEYNYEPTKNKELLNYLKYIRDDNLLTNKILHIDDYIQYANGYLYINGSNSLDTSELNSPDDIDKYFEFKKGFQKSSIALSIAELVFKRTKESVNVPEIENIEDIYNIPPVSTR